MCAIGDKTRIHASLFHVLRKLCGHLGILPTQYDLSQRSPDSDDALIVVSEHSVARGGFADVWLGRYRGQQVAIKEFRIWKDDNVEKIRKVCDDAPILY